MSGPILVLGAHRSGTSALVRVLGELGLFTGARRDPNDEAWFFLGLNDWLLRQCGGRWDHPEPIRDLIAHADARALAVDYLRLSVASRPRCCGFLGLGRTLRTPGGVPALREPWGFKDPRTTFTLPLWLEVFPTAKVLHIHRHGVDVAASLRARQRRNLERSRRLFARNRPALRWLAKRAGFTDSVRCATLEGAFALWESYVVEARRHVAALGDRALTVSYDDWMADPGAFLERVVGFCGLDGSASAAQRERALALVRTDRAGAHREDPELAAFADRVRERGARALGRSPADPAASSSPERVS